MIRLFLVLSLVSSPAWAKFSTEPSGCLDKFAPPCSVLTQTKSELQNPEFKLFTSADALFQFQDAHNLYLARGILWIQATTPLTVQGKFGKAFIREAGEYWVAMTSSQMTVRSLKGDMAVQPRGTDEMEVKQGFETRVTYVNQQTHEAEYTVPMVLDLAKHLADLTHVFPKTGMNLQEYATNLGRVVAEAAQVNADWYQSAVQRKVSSAEERENRLKAEEVHNIRRDSYLQKLYRSKNNFEDQ